MVVAQTGFKDEEYIIPKEIFEKEGHKVRTTSLSRAIATGVGGLKVQPDMAIHEANPEFFDAIVIVGGPGSPILARTEEVLALVKNANEAGKIMAAICLGPMVLANAGVLAGKNATVYPDSKALITLRNGCAKYLEQPVVIDENIVTADSPPSAGEFGEAVVQLLKKEAR